MIILLGKDKKYSIGDDFMMINMPLKMEDATSTSLSDFQWWAYSKDFEEWLKKNPREWTADSIDNKKIYGGSSNLIEESEYKYDYIDFEESSRVVDFDSFKPSQIFEDEPQNNDKSNKEAGIKFRFAYNKLRSEGKIENEFVVASLTEGADKAVFLEIKDGDGKPREEFLRAYRMIPLIVSGESKMVLVKITESLPGGLVTDDETAESLWKEAADTLLKYGITSGVGLAIWTLVSYGGGAYAVLKVINKLSKLGKGVDAGKKMARLRSIVKKNQAIKGLFGSIKPFASLVKAGKDSVRIGKGVVKGAQFVIKGSAGIKDVTRMARLASRGFKLGAELGSKGAIETIPLIGWALAAIDVIGSTVNWYSSNQAPRYDDVEDFAKGEFTPKTIPIGVPITVCWSQEAGGAWGTVLNFVANNDTRTTMELVKVSDTGGKSIFIMTKVNSKELAKQLVENDMTLLSFSDSSKIERGWFDNDDLDFNIAAYPSMDKHAAPFVFEGICNWNDLKSYYDKAEGNLLIEDTDAPNEYNFYFSDSDGEKINVSGKKATNDQLKNYSESDLLEIFGVTEIPKTYEGLSDSGTPLIERAITSFAEFKNSLRTVSVYEEDKKTEIGGGDDEAELTDAEKSGPAKIAVYIIKEKEYANPELRGNQPTGDFTNFLLDPEEYGVSDGTSIDPEVNNGYNLEDCIKGIYTYVKKKVQDEEDDDKKDDDKKDDDKKDDDKKDDDSNKKEDDYYIKANANDISVKNKKSSTVIRDKNYSGGVNLFDLFLTDKEKEMLNIDGWKTISFAKEFYDNRGDVVEVKLKNRYAPIGDKSRVYRVIDGESFEIAKKFVEETKDRIKYE